MYRNVNVDFQPRARGRTPRRPAVRDSAVAALEGEELIGKLDRLVEEAAWKRVESRRPPGASVGSDVESGEASSEAASSLEDGEVRMGDVALQRDVGRPTSSSVGAGYWRRAPSGGSCSMSRPKH